MKGPDEIGTPTTSVGRAKGEGIELPTRSNGPGLPRVRDPLASALIRDNQICRLSPS